jgi:prevent-host-death family protein
MGTHTVAEARDRLPELIARAREGEAVVITQDGTPVAEITPLHIPVRKRRRLPQADIEWLDKHRVPRIRMTVDSATLVRDMRDESDP